MKLHIHYGWVICILCVLTMFCTMGLASNTFSIYVNAFIEENGFTRAQGASLSTVRCVASLLGTILCGVYYNKLNMRKGLSLAVAMIGISFLIYSRAHTLLIFYVGAFVAGLGYGLGTMVPVTMMINRWFAEKQGFVLGFASAGTGMATILCPPLITAGLSAGGVSLAASCEGLLVLIYAGIMLFLLRNTPSEVNLLPYGAKDVFPTSLEANVPAPSGSRLPRHAEKLPLAAAFLIGMITAPNAESLAVHLTTSGLDPIRVAAAVSTFGLAMTIAKFIYGSMTDHIGIFRTNLIFTVILCLAFFFGYAAGNGSETAAFLSAAGMGTGYSMTTITFSLYAHSFYSGKKAADAVRRFWIATLSGSLVFTTVPGLVADLTGSYRLYLLGSIPVLLGGITILQILYKKYVLR
ncbi:MAG: MFS transporter [Anaerovoracaceae bacterium]